MMNRPHPIQLFSEERNSIGRFTSALFTTALFAWTAFVPISAPGQNSNWPAFRNDGSGMVSVDQVPSKWSPNENIRWRSEIPGYGQSAPVIWNKTVFLTSTSGPWQEHGFVHAFDLDTGTKRWTVEVNATTRVENYFRNSRAASTCVVDNQRVISFFPGGDVTAMDHSGNTLWTVPLFKKYGTVENERGTASSLAQTRELVFVLVDHHGPSYLIALRKADGSVAWKADRGDRVPSWSSPVVMKHNDRNLMIVSSSDTVDAYSADNGELLWSVGDIYGNHIPSAAVCGNSIFVGSTERAHGGTNGKMVANSNCRIDLQPRGENPGYVRKWQTERANSYYSTPLAFKDYVYYVNKSGILICVDRETGKQHFKKRIGNPCWASAIGVQRSDGESFVYFFMKNGFTLILQPDDEFKQVARNQLWDAEQMLEAAAAAKRKRQTNQVPADEAPPKEGPEKIFAGMPESQLHKMFSYGDPAVYSAAIVEGHLIIRTGQHLYCIASTGFEDPK